MKGSPTFDIYNTLSKKTLHTTYEELIQISEDMYFQTIIDPVTSEHHHQITRPVVASINNLKRNGHMKNIIYTEGLPTIIELTNTHLTPKYNDYFQLSYVLTGKIVIQIHDTEIIAEEGGVLLIDDNTYYCEDISKSEGTIVNISVNPQIVNDIFSEQSDEDTLQGFLHRNFMKEKEKQNMLYYRPNESTENSVLNIILSDLLFELKNQKKGYVHVCKGYLFRIFDHIASEYQYSYTKQEQDSFRKYLFNDIKVYLFRYYKDVQIQDLVDNFHYQRNYFNRLIKEYTGLTYSKYLIEIRILQAQHLLEKTDYNIEEIMAQIGYNNKGFFYNNFKELIGMNPAEYRKSLKSFT